MGNFIHIMGMAFNKNSGYQELPRLAVLVCLSQTSAGGTRAVCTRSGQLEACARSLMDSTLGAFCIC